MTATIGCFVLWFGWFGFNPGSTMAADVNAMAEIAVTTNTAAASLTATLTCWLLLGKPDLGMTLDGGLAGLVAITATCAFVTVGASLVIGSIAGVIVVLAVIVLGFVVQLGVQILRHHTAAGEAVTAKRPTRRTDANAGGGSGPSF